MFIKNYFNIIKLKNSILYQINYQITKVQIYFYNKRVQGWFRKNYKRL